jgi:hypothetical protein
VEYKKSEDFAKASARGEQSRAKKEHDHHLGQGGYAFAVPSGGRWKKTFSHKVPYQQSLIGPSK